MPCLTSDCVISRSRCLFGDCSAPPTLGRGGELSARGGSWPSTPARPAAARGPGTHVPRAVPRWLCRPGEKDRNQRGRRAAPQLAAGEAESILLGARAKARAHVDMNVRAWAGAQTPLPG